MHDQPRQVVEPVLLEYDIAGKTVELYVTSTDAAAEGAYIFQEVVLDDEYLKHGLELQQGALVIDIGAHIGAFGIRALTAIPHGDLTYIGIEPCLQSFQALRRNLLGSDVQGSADSFFHHNNKTYGGPVHQTPLATRACATYPGNVLLFNTAISNRTGQQVITYYPHMPSNSTFDPAKKQELQAAVMPAHYFSASQELLVPVMTLDQLLHDAGVTGRNIDLLKIDVEGHEVEVLEGMSDETWSCVQQLAIEVHDVVNELGDSSCTTAKTSLTGLHGVTHQPPSIPQDCLLRASEAAAEQPAVLSGALDAAASQNQQAWPSVAISEGSLKPRDGGRVMHIARMLTAMGYSVVVDCPLGLPTNFTLYALKGKV